MPLTCSQTQRHPRVKYTPPPVQTRDQSYGGQHRGGAHSKLHQPYNLPGGNGLLLCQKKGGGLRPCIDFQGLNSITVKYSFSIALVLPTKGQLKCAKTFIFQAFVTEILRDFLNQCVIVYIEDILIYSPTLESHITQVCQVLQQLLQHHCEGEEV